MNLKESFRYQSFYNTLLGNAKYSITDRNHALKVIKTHLKNKANPDAEDIIEVSEQDFVENDAVIEFMCWLIIEREKLTKAIFDAKSSLSFCLDAAVEANKFRQTVNESIKTMLQYSAKKITDHGRDYKFNVEGNQTPYIYDVEVSFEEAFTRDTAKKVMKDTISVADNISALIDAAMVNTTVDYTPVFDVNDTFEDVMSEFVNNIKDNINN